MDCADNKLHIFFLPHLARGHMIPLLDTARLLAEHSVRCTFITTPANASLVTGPIEAAVNAGLAMQLLLMPFPDVGLPPGCENASTIPQGVDAFLKLLRANQLLREPFERLLHDHNPDGIIADCCLIWPADVAESFDIPHVQFNVTSLFANVLMQTVHSQDAHLDADPVTDTIAPLSGLPHRFTLQRSELPILFDYPSSNIMERLAEARRKSLGVIFNTFRKLEHEYVEHVEKGCNIKVWCVGPLQLSGNSTATYAPKNWEAIKNWLDSKEPKSVLYVSFGTECHFSHEQLRELAIGLESSGHPFIWVVRGEKDTMDEWLPEGFEEKVGGRGLVITEWAPQFLILNHPALGGSVLHCGWNSAIESVCAGLPVIAWPLHTEQFLNERLFVEVLKTGVRVLEGEMRVEKLERKKVVSGEKVKEAVAKLLGGGEEVREMRRKAKEYSKLAKMAMEEGGSSYVDFCFLFRELTTIAQERRKAT